MELTQQVSIFLALAAGILSFLSPCVLPLVPSYLSYISGTSFSELEKARTRERALNRALILNASLFILGFSAVFISIGASFSLAGQLLGAYRESITVIGGLVVIFFGLMLTGVVKFSFLMQEHRALEFHSKPAGYFGALAIGFSFGMGWTPCVGPILGAILTLAASRGSAASGTALLAVYAAGLAVPFLLSALAFNYFLGFFQRFKRAIRVIHVGGGVLLIAMGILLVSGYWTILNSYAIKLTPSWLWSLL
ncbi:MAG: cytochrome c biogenesis CcdA family protein [Nitrospinota bacterium]